MYTKGQINNGEISVSHDGKYEDDSLLGHCAMQSCRSLLTFQRCIMMMEAVRTSETSVNFYETTRHNIPEGCNLQINNN
jgi:hypothetical protein